MTEAQDRLLLDWMPFVARWARQQYDRCKVRDYQTILSDGIVTLNRAILKWPGAGPFKGYLVASLKNTIREHLRRERRHQHVGLVQGELGAIPFDDARKCRHMPISMALRPRKRYHGGESIVLKVVIQREAYEALESGDKWKVMHVLGYSAEEIAEEKRKANRREREQASLRRIKAAKFSELFVEPEQLLHSV
jgi:DNA-directed RNA polymerase specialized sigma24 family protein